MSSQWPGNTRSHSDIEGSTRKGLAVVGPTFQKGDTIVRYGDEAGEILTQETVNRIYGRSVPRYLLQTGPNEYVDANTSKGGVGRYINRPKKKSEANAAFKSVLRVTNRGPVVVALRDIYPGEEIHVDYGPHFKCMTPQ